MKKKFLSLLPLLTLTGCIMYNGLPKDGEEEESSIIDSSLESIDSSIASSDVSSESNPVSSASSNEDLSSSSSSQSKSSSSSSSKPVDPTAEIKTYLVLGSVGMYNGNPGNDYPELYIENAIEFIGKPGDPLPGKDEITVNAGNGVFKTWLSYEGLGAPTEHSVVGDTDGQIYYASFDNSGKPIDQPDDEKGVYYFTNNYCWNDVKIYMWNDSGVAKTSWPGDALTNPIKNNHNEDVFKFEIKNNEYTHIIFSGFDTGKNAQVQTKDIDLTYFGNCNNVYITGWEGDKATVGFATFNAA